jgi:hypothetical protein
MNGDKFNFMLVQTLRELGATRVAYIVGQEYDGGEIPDYDGGQISQNRIQILAYIKVNYKADHNMEYNFNLLNRLDVR